MPFSTNVPAAVCYWPLYPPCLPKTAPMRRQHRAESPVHRASYFFPNGGRRGGLGYRLRRVRIALLFAIVTRRVFFISWPEDSVDLRSFDLTCGLHLASIDWRPPWGNIHSMTHENPGHTANVSFASIYAMVNVGKRVMYDKQGDGRVMKTRMRIDYSSSTDLERLFSNRLDPFNVVYLKIKLCLWAEKSLLPNNRTRNLLLPRKEASRTTVSGVDDAFVMTLNRYFKQALFRPSPRVASLVHQRLFASASSSPSSTPLRLARQDFFAVHARTGGDVNESSLAHMRFIMSNMRAHATRLLHCAAEIEPVIGREKIFLAFDSLAFTKEFMSAARARGVEERTQSERTSVHIRRYVAAGDKAGDGMDDICLKFLDVFADVFIGAR